MVGMTPIGQLSWNGADFQVFPMDKFVASVPNDQVAKLKFACPDFAVWQMRRSLGRYYMVKKHVQRRFLNLLVNYQVKNLQHDSR